MPGELARALAFMAALEEGCAERIFPFERGRALFNDTHPLVWGLNVVRVDRPDGANAGELAVAAGRLHDAAGHEHRRIAIADDRAGAALADGFAALGWETDREIVMAYRGPGSRAADTAAVEELPAAVMVPMRLALARTEPWATSEAVAVAVVAGNEHIAETGSARRFGVFADGTVVSGADVFSDGRTAQVENVVTLTAYRGRGLASAIVLRAVEEALAAGHDLVFLVAADDDWPKELYARLGFEPIGFTWSFLKPPAP